MKLGSVVEKEGRKKRERRSFNGQIWLKSWIRRPRQPQWSVRFSFRSMADDEGIEGSNPHVQYTFTQIGKCQKMEKIKIIIIENAWK